MSRSHSNIVTEGKSTKSPIGTQGPTILPRIGESKFQTLDGLLVENPFYMPGDEEIFKMKEQEKELRKEEREKNTSLKIWQKGVKQDKIGRLKALYNTKSNDGNADDSNKINIVEAAKMAIKNKVRQKEPMHKFIDKKREMFLFQMLIDHKREQINQFEELTRLQERGLQKAELMLEDDLEAFNQYLDTNKSKSRSSIKKADDATRSKNDKINEIKNENEKLSDLATKNGTKIERLRKLWTYKTFLDQITPKEFLETQKKRKMERKLKRERERELLKKTKSESFYKEKEKKGGQYETYKLDKELIELLEDSDEEFEMFFQSPDQIEKYFETLEERSLFLMSNTREIEQMFENVRHGYEETKAKLNEQLANKKKIKADMEKSVKMVKQDITNLGMIKNENDTHEKLMKLTNEINTEHAVFFDKNLEMKSAISLLTDIEKKLDDQLKKIKEFMKDKKDIFDKEIKECKKKRQELKTQMDQENSQKVGPQKNDDENLPLKRIGRPIMKRSWITQGKQEESVKEEIDPEQEEIQRHLT